MAGILIGMPIDDTTSSRTLSARHRKLVLKIEYLEAELAEAHEFMNDATVEFTTAYHLCLSTYSDDERDSVEGKVKKAQPPDPPEVQKTEGDEKEVKKLFRKIAGETHPDKLAHMEKETQEVREGLFDKAKKACAELNWYELSRLAEHLNLNIPSISEGHVNMLENSAQLLQQKIAVFQSTVAWQWYALNPVEKQGEFMHAYVKSML